MGDERARRISHRYLPSREAIVEILESVLDLMYPGYFGRRDLNSDNLGAHVAQSGGACWRRSSSARWSIACAMGASGRPGASGKPAQRRAARIRRVRAARA